MPRLHRVRRGILAGTLAGILTMAMGLPIAHAAAGCIVSLGVTQTATTVTGTSGDDTIDCSGATSGKMISGYGGNDSITGTSFDDVITGGGGDDTLMGGSGNDFVQGSVGNDSLYGGDGNDTLIGKAGNDIVKGGAGDDLVNGDEGNDTLTGGSGNDVLGDVSGIDTFSGGSGNDYIDSADSYVGGPHDIDTVTCGPGTDSGRVDTTDLVRGCESMTSY